MAWLKLAASSARPAVLDLSPNSFVEFLKSRNISAFHIAFDANKSAFHFSHPEIFKPVAENWLADPLKDWDNHEAVFVRVSPQGVLQSATVQHTKRGAAAGGVRNWTYETVDGFLRDGLRLGKGMGAKNAVAGLWWGGGKGVMARNSGSGLSNGNDVAARRAVYESYGTFISALKGCYVTAEDVGTHVEDMAHIFSQTRHTTCIPEKFGGSGNPSIPTARGVVEAITTGFEELNMKLEGSTVGLIGLGNVGSYVARYLLDRGVGRIIGRYSVSINQSRRCSNHPDASICWFDW